MKRIIIRLKPDEIEMLKTVVKKGKRNAREIIRANILLLANKGKKGVEIADILGINRSTVAQVKKRYTNDGIQCALQENLRTGQPKKYNAKDEAEIIAVACTNPPRGRKRWTIRLLTKEMKKKKGLKTINRESVRLVLKKAKLSLG